MLAQNTPIDQTVAQRSSLLARSLLSQQEQQLKLLQRAESLAQSARKIAKTGFIKSKRRTMTTVSIPKDLRREQLITNLSQASAIGTVTTLLTLTRWVMEDVPADVVQSRIFSLIENGLTHKCLNLLTQEADQADGFAALDCKRFRMEGRPEEIVQAQEHAARLLFGLSLGNRHTLTLIHRHGITDHLLSQLEMRTGPSANATITHYSVATLSNLVTHPKIRDECLEHGILMRASDLAEVFADSEGMQLDLLYLTRNCLAVQPALGQITLKKLPKVIPGLKLLGFALQSLADQLPFDQCGQENWISDHLKDALSLALQGLSLLTSRSNLPLYSELATQFKVGGALCRILIQPSSVQGCGEQCEGEPLVDASLKDLCLRHLLALTGIENSPHVEKLLQRGVLEWLGQALGAQGSSKFKIRVCQCLSNIVSEERDLARERVIQEGLIHRVVKPMMLSTETRLSLKIELLVIYCNLLAKGQGSYDCLSYLMGECEIVKVIAHDLAVAVEGQNAQKKPDRYQASQLALVCITVTKKLFKACERVRLMTSNLLGEGSTHAAIGMLAQVKSQLEEHGALDSLETLQLCESQEVFEKAQKLLLKNFEEDLSSLGSLKSLFQ